MAILKSNWEEKGAFYVEKNKYIRNHQNLVTDLFYEFDYTIS